MLKEMHESPEAAANSVRGRITDDGRITFNEFDVSDAELAAFTQVRLLGMGTSLHAAMIGEHVIEDWAGVLAKAQDASEFRYREPTVGRDTLTVAITQSGETADTLVGLQQAKARRSLSVAITNVIASSAARDADGAIYLNSGPEIGVASTKTLIAHLVSLYLLAGKLAQAHRRWPAERNEDLVRTIRSLPDGLRAVLEDEPRIKDLARKYSRYRDFMYIGRGINHAVAMEGALKLKEISYVHAEGTSGGYLKHGPIALLDPEFPVVAICTESPTKEKMVSNVHEVAAREAPVLAVVSAGDHSVDEIAADVLEVPAGDEAATAVYTTLALQLFAYHVAVELGCDVDQPRNLAKSVTVE
jgi:glucosamine--fructose-6-phosphate aminotransferase (isomerizing)